MAFDRLVWQRDRALLDDLVFRLELEKHEDKDSTWDLGEDCFSLYKVKWVLDNYAKLWAARPGFRPQNVVEIGIWDGASLVLWYEQFRPRKLVGVDLGFHAIDNRQIRRNRDSAYFKNYVASRGLQNRIKTHWGVRQQNKDQMRRICDKEFDEPLDLVIDDGSHLYQYTRASFEALFPRLRRGGLYIIEDWGWSHWSGYDAPDHRWADWPPLTRLILELVEASGSQERFLQGKGSLSVLRTLIAGITITPDFAVIERGDVLLAELKDFDLDKYIVRRPQDGPYTGLQKFDELRLQHDDLLTKHAQLESSLKYTEDWLRELETNDKNLLKFYTELETNHRELQGYYRDLEESHKTLQNYYTEQDASRHELQHAYDELSGNYQDLIRINGELESSNRDWQKCNDEMQTSSRELQLSYEATNRDWQKCYDELQTINRDLQQAYESSTRDWQKWYDQQVASNRELLTSYTELEAGHRELHKSYSELETSNRDLHSSYNDLDRSYQDLQADHHALETGRQELETEHQRLHKDHNDLLASHQELQAQHYDLEQRHIPLTYFSGLLRETLRAFGRKLKRVLPWTRT